MYKRLSTRATIWVAIVSALLMPLNRASAAPATQPAVDGAFSTLTARQLCGVNCLYLICTFHQKTVDHADLLRLLNPSEAGVSMLAMKQCAEQMGFEVRAYDMSSSRLLSLHQPFIMYLPASGSESTGPGHYVVVLPVSEPQGLWIFDPPKAKQFVPADKIEKYASLKVQVMLFKPRQPTMSASR